MPVRTSGGGAVIDAVDDRPALVLATPGAEPVADGGYAAAVLLDGWVLLSRPDLRAGEEALRRWLAAAALVRGSADGGRVVVVAPGELRPVQALVRWQPRWHAERELEERRALHLPPAGRMAALTGSAARGRRAARGARAAAGRRGARAGAGRRPGAGRPDDDEPAERMLVRVPRQQGAELAAALKAAQAGRSARKAPGAVRVELDPASSADRSRRSDAQCATYAWMASLSIVLCVASRRVAVSVQPIRLFGDPVLTTPAEPVTTFDKELRVLVKDLAETMLDAPGARPGRAADRRQPPGVHLRRRRRGRAPRQPGHQGRRRRGAGRRRGLPVASRPDVPDHPHASTWSRPA